MNAFEDVYKQLKDTFTRADVEQLLLAMGINSPVRTVLYRWRLLGVIEAEEGRVGRRNTKAYTNFKKIKR